MLKPFSNRMLQVLNDICTFQCEIFEYNKLTLNALAVRKAIRFNTKTGRIFPTAFGKQLHRAAKMLS